LQKWTKELLELLRKAEHFCFKERSNIVLLIVDKISICSLPKAIILTDDAPEILRLSNPI
jgi:hypothetical protein